ncbi:MAG: hypothetical protein WKG00_15090 [Polyangiaceae bacterium]
MVGVLIALFSREAQAQDAHGDGVASWLSRGGLLVGILPSEVGGDVALGDRAADPRLRVGWSYQLPICWINDPPSLYSTCTAGHPLMRHRVVASFRFAIGDQQAPRSGEVVSATFDARIGYRYRLLHEGRPVVPYFGVGSTCELWPDGLPRASVSPELGLHIGKEWSALPPNLVLGWQGDVFFAYEPRVRLMAFVGYSFL